MGVEMYKVGEHLRIGMAISCPGPEIRVRYGHSFVRIVDICGNQLICEKGGKVAWFFRWLMRRQPEQITFTV
jgi:hypothetical protein